MTAVARALRLSAIATMAVTRKAATQDSCRATADIMGAPWLRWSPRRSSAGPAPLRMAGGAFVDHLDSGGVEGCDQLDQGIDIAAHHQLGSLHALNRRHGKPGQFGEPALVDARSTRAARNCAAVIIGLARDPMVP